MYGNALAQYKTRACSVTAARQQLEDGAQVRLDVWVLSTNPWRAELTIEQLQKPGVYAATSLWIDDGGDAAFGCVPAVRFSYSRTTAEWPVSLWFRRLQTSKPGPGVRL